LQQDAQITLAVRERQNSYIQQSHPITLTHIQAWPWWLRIWNNLLATLNPVL